MSSESVVAMSSRQESGARRCTLKCAPAFLWLLTTVSLIAVSSTATAESADGKEKLSELGLTGSGSANENHSHRDFGGVSLAPDRPHGYAIKPIPDWVKPTPAFDPELVPTGEVTHGFHSRLDDFQYNGLVHGQSTQFNAIEYALSNRYGVENYSSIEISFDPSYEQLDLHELTIKRGDQHIDKLSTSRFDLLRTESDRAALIYDGTRTLAIVMDDVRIGDVVRYSYSLSGENPIYQGHREFRIHTQLWSPLDRQYTRVLTAADRPLNRRVRGENIPLILTEENGIQEIILDQRAVPEFSIEDDVPNWHYNRGTIVFSDMNDWRSVVDWALPMYQLPEQPAEQASLVEGNNEIANIASVIRNSHESVEEQVGAALNWVQEEIRYFGIELGKNSHWPSRPEETLHRRFGDCKDKALLLIALLRELGIESHAALVNTNRGLEAANYPYRMHAFNHVIVHVQLDDRVHFIDPTRYNQMGALGKVHEPNYGRALILAESTTGLTEMGTSRSRFLTSITKTLTLPTVDVATIDVSASVKDSLLAIAAGTNSADASSVADEQLASMVVETRRSGLAAENIMDSLETDGARALSQAYWEYYEEYFKGIEAIGQADFHVGHDVLTIGEKYSIDKFWTADENVERYRWVHADEVIAFLDSPDSITDRKLPYELIHPVRVEETIEVIMPEGLRIDDLQASVQNSWVSFSKESTLNDDGTRLTVNFRFQTLTDEVAAEDLAEYAESIVEISDLASFYLEDRPTLGSALAEATSELTEGGAQHPLMAALFLMLLFVRRGVSIVSIAQCRAKVGFSVRKTAYSC